MALSAKLHSLAIWLLQLQFSIAIYVVLALKLKQLYTLKTVCDILYITSLSLNKKDLINQTAIWKNSILSSSKYVMQSPAVTLNYQRGRVTSSL